MTTAPDADDDDLTDADREALQLAVDLTLAGDPEGASRAKQIRDFLEGYDEGYGRQPPRPWRDVAEFCARCQQSRRLNLRPWQTAPCRIGDREDAEAILRQGFRPAANDPSVDVSDCAPARLLLDMLDANVSRWNPNPLAAIAAAKQARP